MLIMTPMVLFVLIAFLGMSFDVSFLYWQKRRMQTAADAAVIGALRELMQHGSPEAMQAAARRDAGMNGFADGQNQVATALYNPPVTGAHTEDPSYYEAVISQPQPTFFLRILNFTSVPMTVRAQGRLGGGTHCVVLLGDGEEQMTVEGVFSAACGVMANSITWNSLLLKSGTATARSFETAGGAVGAFSPMPKTWIRRILDPLSALAAPEFPGAQYFDTEVTNTTPLRPGVYHGGIRIRPNVHAYFSPGVYILNGTGLIAEGGPDTFLEGSGVTFYLTAGRPYSGAPELFPAEHANAPPVLRTEKEGGMSLSAPVDGPLAGVLLFQDRDPEHQAAEFEIQGNSRLKLEGILYLPGAKLTFGHEAANSAAYTIIVARSLRVSGTKANLIINADYSSLPHGSPLQSRPVLTE